MLYQVREIRLGRVKSRRRFSSLLPFRSSENQYRGICWGASIIFSPRQSRDESVIEATATWRGQSD